ncbi:MAG: hypothetical protein R2744_04760 [Bacteroidales bacterium]
MGLPVIGINVFIEFHGRGPPAIDIPAEVDIAVVVIAFVEVQFGAVCRKGGGYTSSSINSCSISWIGVTTHR